VTVRVSVTVTVLFLSLVVTRALVPGSVHVLVARVEDLHHDEVEN